MPLTSDQAIEQLQAVQDGNTTGHAKTGISGLVQSGLDAALTYGIKNNQAIQEMINSLLVSKGVLSADQEQQVNDLVDQERKRQAAIKVKRTNTTLILIGVGIVVITATVIIINKRNQNG